MAGIAPRRWPGSGPMRGYYHDGRFATLLDVVERYDQLGNLNLSDQEKRDLVEYLKSLPEEDS